MTRFGNVEVEVEEVDEYNKVRSKGLGGA